jgi:hypothetical protein
MGTAESAGAGTIAQSEITVPGEGDDKSSTAHPLIGTFTGAIHDAVTSGNMADDLQRGLDRGQVARPEEVAAARSNTRDAIIRADAAAREMHAASQTEPDSVTARFLGGVARGYLGAAETTGTDQLPAIHETAHHQSSHSPVESEKATDGGFEPETPPVLIESPVRQGYADAVKALDTFPPEQVATAEAQLTEQIEQVRQRIQES